MTFTRRPNTIARVALIAWGVISTGMGLYFVLFRSPLLPEDVRFMGLSPAEAEVIGAKLGIWLRCVFTVLGGQIIATGVLIMGLSQASSRLPRRLIVATLIVAGIASIGLMTAVNFVIQSDFKWFLLGVALLWVFGIASLWGRRDRTIDGKP